MCDIDFFGQSKASVGLQNVFSNVPLRLFSNYRMQFIVNAHLKGEFIQKWTCMTFLNATQEEFCTKKKKKKEKEEALKES